MVNHRIYALGGVEGRADLSAVDVFDPASQSWSVGPPLPAPRAFFSAAVMPWRVPKAAPKAEAGASANAGAAEAEQKEAEAEWEHRLYVCGGFVGGQYMQSVEVLHVESGEWESVAPMKGRKRNAAACTLL